MRPGNLEDFGWNKIVRDFDRAIALARLSGIQSALVQAAREASWTEASMKGEDARPFKLSPRGLAKVFGCHHTKIIDAVSDLVAMKVFLKSDDGHMLINKDYRTWVNTSKKANANPLFSGDQLGFITEPKRHRTRKTGSENATTPVAKTLPAIGALVAKTLPPGSENATTPVAKTLPPPPAQLIGTRGIEDRERDLREIEIKTREAPNFLAELSEDARIVAKLFLDDPAWCHKAEKFGLLADDWIKDGMEGFAAIEGFKFALRRKLSPLAAKAHEHAKAIDAKHKTPAEIPLTPSQQRERLQNEALYARLTGKTGKANP